MIACVDVDYRADRAVAAALWFERWDSVCASRERTRSIAEVAAYVPGELYRREMPCILDVLQEELDGVVTVVVDGYVWLDAEHERPGLGAHLHRALGGQVAVIGVAKSPFRGNTGAAELLRGASARPLHISAEGMPLERAVASIESMHGPYRVPTLLRRVDRLARDG